METDKQQNNREQVKMKEVEMRGNDIMDEIKFEDSCGINTFLQYLLSLPKDSFNCYHQINDEGEIVGWVIRDKKTNDEVHY